jgi:outer membrane protein assembly factor BamB/tetratricopeptide (TPR) repeat protein
MRTLRLRLSLLTGLLLALAVAVTAVPRSGLAQFQPIPQPDLPGEPVEPPKATVDKLTFPENRDTSLKFEAVLDYLNRARPDWKVVCELAQGLLNAKSDYFFQYNANSNDPRADKRRVSVKEEMNRLIGTFAQEGRQFYELTYGGAAADLLDRARKNNFDRGLLTEAAQRYFHTKAGAEAARLLATIHLDLGNYSEAAYGFTRLLLRADAEEVMDAKSLVKAGIAMKRAGDGKLPDTFADLWARVEKKFPRAGLQFGDRMFPMEQVKAEWDRKIEHMFDRLSDAYVGMKGGNATRNGISAAGTPFLIPTFSKPILYNDETADEKAGAAFIREGIRRTYEAAKKNPNIVPIPAGFPVTAPNLIILRGYDGVYAYHSKDGKGPTGKPVQAGDLAWFSPSSGAAQALFAGNDVDLNRAERDNARNAWSSYWQTKMPGVLFENPNQGSLSHDGKLVYFVDDMAVPPAPSQQFNPNMGGFNPGAAINTGARGMKDYSRLLAVEVDTGLLAWSLGGLPAADPKPGAGIDDDNFPNAAALTEGSYFLGPPLPYNGKLYALFERDGALKLACLDPFKTVIVPPTSKDVAGAPAPDVVWVQNLGKAMTPLKQDPLRRIQASFLACADGVIVCPTNSGAVVAVDLNARSLLWAHTYATSEIPDGGGPVGPGRPFPRPRPGIPQPSASPLATERWRSASPIISGGRVVVAAYDADQVQCLDLRTGKLLWSEARQPQDLYVGGVANNRVMIVGSKGTRAVGLVGEDVARKVPAPAWPNELRTGIPCGHGVIGKDGTFYLPMVGDDVNTDARIPQIWAINPVTGLAASKTPFRLKPGQVSDGEDNRLLLGNLVFHDDMMYSQSPTRLTAFPLIEAKRKEMDAALANNPNDPVGLTSRGELLLDDGKLQLAVADFKKAQANDPNDATKAKISEKLYMAYTEILRKDFTDGEKFLTEYKTLCELSPTADEGPERQRQLDEQVRRRGLYYSLVAEGREKQGKLVEAFQNFQAYAALGEKGRLLPVPGDPNTMARSDVWASGRIDAMLRNAKTDEARKPLEAQVNAEWEAVKSGNDLKRLGDFVKVFGPYFATGREAQFLLAEKLMLTNNEDDRVQAELFLLGLLGQTSGDPAQRTVTARATEALARLMTARTLMEDAVGLYAKLGTEFADVVVRDGKTGADIYSDLITDKQLWPALELPQPVSLSGKYKAEISAGGYRQPSYSLNIDGDQLPFIRRHRFALDINQNDGGQSVILKMIDRVSGEDRAKFTGLPGFQINPNTGMNPLYTSPGLSLLAVHGHLALLHCGSGQFIYCYDLSAVRPGSSKGELGKELWKVNLLGKTAANNSMIFDQTAGGDEPVGRSVNDDWEVRLGQAMTLQASYASYLTRDGLVTVNPLTGDPLWTRGGVSGKARVYGDATHIYLFETSGKSTLLRVLRAADGAAVGGGARDLSGMIPNGQVRLFGSRLLLTEGGANEVRRLRLYDVVSGKDAWVKEAPAGSVPLRTEGTDLCGYLTQDGKVEVIDAATGKSVLSAAIDADKVEEHLNAGKKFAVVSPLVMADADRCYLFLNRRDDSQGNAQQWNGSPQISSLQMDGHLYAFSRATGKRLWYTEGQLRAEPNQNAMMGPRVALDRFDEMPCVVSMSFTQNPQRGQQTMHMLAIDKKTGALKAFKEALSNSGYQSFTGVHNDRGAISVTNNQFQVKMTPDDEK